MSLKIWLNGELVPEEQATVSVFDHGLLYGDGVFEGIRAYGGRVFRLDRLSRLQVDEQIFEARPLPVGWALDHLRRGANRDRQRVVLVVAAPLITVVEAFRYHDAEFEQIGDGIVTTVLVDAWQQVLPSLAFLDANFTVVEPQAFGAGPRHFREHGE